MKKRNLMVALLCSMCLAVSSPVPAMADGTKVVTLGADLTQDQKNTMMNYFKADSSQVQVITVTRFSVSDRFMMLCVQPGIIWTASILSPDTSNSTFSPVLIFLS